MNALPCLSCKVFEKTKEIIEYDSLNKKLLLRFCPFFYIEISEKELTEREKKVLDVIKNKHQIPNGARMNFVLRNRIYTIGDAVSVKNRFLTDFNIDLLSQDCLFFVEMFLFSENFKKN